MSLVENTLNFSNPRDRRFSQPTTKVLQTDSVKVGTSSIVIGTKQSAVIDASSGTSARLTNVSGVVSLLAVTSEPGGISAIASDAAAISNNNFSTLDAQLNNLVGDLGDIRTQLNALLAAVRSYGAIAN